MGLPQSVTQALMEVVGVLFPRWQLTFFQRHILIMVLLQIKHIPGRGTEQKLSAFEGP